MSEERAFGAKAEGGRWLFVLVGLVMNLCLGAVYAYSIFKPAVEKVYKVNAFQGNLPFMTFLLFFAITMFFGGKVMEKLGPRKLALIGGIIVGLGWILSSFTAPNIWALVLTYGVVAGSGVGLVYGCPVAMGARWFPDRKGLAVGLMLAGFGGSALVTGKIADILIGDVKVLSADALAQSLPHTFLYFGLAFSVILVLLALPFRFPTAGWKPAGWAPKAGSTAASDFTAGQMVKTSTFWGLFICFLIGSLSGLMAIGISKSVGGEIILIASATGTMLVGVFAIFNAVGRPLFGALTDKLGPRNTGALNLVLILAVSLLMIFAAPGVYKLNDGTAKDEGGKLTLTDGRLVDADGAVELKKGDFVIAPGVAESVGGALVLKAESVSAVNGASVLPAAKVTTVAKDGPAPLKKGAVVLKAGALTSIVGSIAFYIIAFAGFWLCLGGWLAIAPASTATFFGMKNYARNYGTVFFAYGLGAILGGIISGQAKDVFGSYTFAFYPTAGLAALGLVLVMLLLKAPKQPA